MHGRGTREGYRWTRRETCFKIPLRRCRKVLLGDVVGPPDAEPIAVIEANIYDMHPKFYACVAERLFAQGALDVTRTSL
jgi:uncharacterized protein (DUF111 family)